MAVQIHLHAQVRMSERGATKEEVVATIESGERFPAKFGRTGFRRNYSFNGEWRSRYYETKQVEVHAVQVEAIRLSDEMVVDMPPDGKIHGIELLNANEQLRDENMATLLVINQATGEQVELPLAL